MIIFILPVMLVAWLEASWAGWLDLTGVSLPLTLLSILYLRYRSWVSLSETVLLAGLGGYVLDVLASPRHGLVLSAMLVASALGGWLLGRSSQRWQRWAALGVGLVLYQLILSLGLGWPELARVGFQVLSFTGLSLALFGLMRLIGRRVEGWL